MSLLVDDMIVRVENPEDYRKTKTKTISGTKYSKVVGYHVNIQRSIAFL